METGWCFDVFYANWSFNVKNREDHGRLDIRAKTEGVANASNSWGIRHGRPVKFVISTGMITLVAAKLECILLANTPELI